MEGEENIENIEEADDLQEKIEEEQEIWKENIPLLYDQMIHHILPWPTLTVQFLPYQSESQKVILGTHTSGQDSEFLILADLHIPLKKEDVGEFVPKLEIKKKIPHESEVTRARYMTQKPNFVATKSVKGRVDIFDTSKEDKCFLKTLTGHVEDGYGIDWDPFHPGWISSCGEDKIVNIWDIQKGDKPIIQFGESGDVVEDCAWSKKMENVLGVCGDEKELLFYDIRMKILSKKKKDAHTKEIYSLDFHPYTDYLVATGSGDGTVKLWDFRKIDTSLAKLSNHSDEIFVVQWCQQNEHLLASGSADRRVMVWDVSKIGSGQTAEEAEDGPPELLFVHSGHTSKINDLCWSSKDELMVVSCDSLNALQAWSILDQIVYPLKVEDVPDGELEDDEIVKSLFF